MLTDFQNSFIDRLSSKFLELNITPHLKCIATPPCEMFLLKNCNDLELSEVNFHTRRLSHSKQLLKNIHPLMLVYQHPVILL